MATFLDEAHKISFPKEGSGDKNVKFCVGWDRQVSDEQIAEQFVRGEAQVEAKTTAPVENIDD